MLRVLAGFAAGRIDLDGRLGIDSARQLNHQVAAAGAGAAWTSSLLGFTHN